VFFFPTPTGTRRIVLLFLVTVTWCRLSRTSIRYGSFEKTVIRSRYADTPGTARRNLAA